MSEGIAFEILYIQNEAENGIKNKKITVIKVLPFDNAALLQY